MITHPYEEQRMRWPQHGRHILARFDAATVVVYQAYRPEIAAFATQHGWFGGEFSYQRMSWIKPNFLWMMYRSGWGTKQGQEVVLAITIRRDAFDKILAQAVHSSFQPDLYRDEEEWRARLTDSQVRLQWDPDHDPFGMPQIRRAIQLGMRGDVLRRFGREWIVSIEDLSSFVAQNRTRVAARDLAGLVVPAESVYPVADAATAHLLQLDPAPGPLA